MTQKTQAETKPFGLTDSAPLSRPVHGGIRPEQLRELGLSPELVFDFSASVSPLGPPAGLWDVLQKVDLTAYPDPSCLELREALAEHLSRDGGKRVRTEEILVGNGSTELIHLLTRSFLAPKQDEPETAALILTPTYGEYLGACRLAGARVVELAASREKSFQWDLAQAADLIVNELRPELVFLCNPNNPTGVYLAPEAVEYLAHACSQTGSLLVVDEAYSNLVDDAWNTLGLLENGHTLLLRSMTKDYALTGLRLGYSLAPAEMTDRLARYQPDWSVNALAQAAGVAALADEGYLPSARQAVGQSKHFLKTELEQIGFVVYPSAANFFLVQMGDGNWWRDRLMRRGFFVRDCASFGLPDCVRLGIRAMPDCQRLIEAVRLEMDSWTEAARDLLTVGE